MTDGRSLEEREAEELLKRFNGFFASRRDGLVLLKLDIKGKTALVWVRASPITQKALHLYDKITSKHEYDTAILYKLRKEADHVTFNDLKKRFRKIIFSPNELEET